MLKPAIILCHLAHQKTTNIGNVHGGPRVLRFWCWCQNSSPLVAVQVEAYYFSAAAGHKRILGNRRFGENGFISSGRMQARPVAQSSRSGKVLLCLCAILGVPSCTLQCPAA